MRLLLAFCLLTITTLSSSCQQQEIPANAEANLAEHRAEDARSRLASSEGGQLVLRTIEAHGGLDAWFNAPTSSYTWEYSNVGSNIRFKSRLVADNTTRQVYHDLIELGTPDNPQPIQAWFAWDGKEAWISPDTLEQPNPRFWATTGYYFESIPFILSDPGLRYERLPDAELDGTLYDMVRVSYGDAVGDSPDDTYVLYVNKETSLVDAIRYTVTYGRGGQPAGEPLRETLFYYEEYVTVDGLTVATRFRGFNVLDGVVKDFKNEAWADEISFTKPFDASRLIMPEDGRVHPMPASSE